MKMVSLKESQHALREFCADAQCPGSGQALLPGKMSLGTLVAGQKGELLHMMLKKGGLGLHHCGESRLWTAK